MRACRVCARLLIGFLFFSFIITSFSPTSIKPGSRIHLIFFGDTENNGLSQNISEERFLFEHCIPFILSSKTGLPVEKYFFCGSDFNRESLDNINQLFNSGDNDVILFCYSGHGSNDSLSSFPRLAVRKINGDKKSKYLDEVYSELKYKPHRLLIVAGQVCNTHARSRSAQLNKKNYRDSLFKSRSDNSFCTNYLITSSKQGQNSHASSGRAGYFIWALLDVLTEVDSLEETSVKVYLERWKEKTMMRAANVDDEKLKRIQEPFWIAEE